MYDGMDLTADQEFEYKRRRADEAIAAWMEYPNDHDVSMRDATGRWQLIDFIDNTPIMKWAVREMINDYNLRRGTSYTAEEYIQLKLTQFQYHTGIDDSKE